VHLHLLHHVLAQLLGQPSQQRGDQEADLRGPGRRVGPNDQDVVAERDRRAVGGDLRPHDPWPTAHDPADRHVDLPATLGHEPFQAGAERLRVAIVPIATTGTSRRRTRPSRTAVTSARSRPQTPGRRGRPSPLDRGPRSARCPLRLGLQAVVLTTFVVAVAVLGWEQTGVFIGHG
jgi:hypothetical protein